MKVTIKTIPHALQRYVTVGDWVYDGEGTLNILVSDLGDSRYEALVALHELVEALSCVSAGVSQDAVDDFDFAYEQKREKGDDSEPGDDIQCPYRVQHSLATGIERIMAAHVGVDWKSYEEAINKL